ncbi:MAG: LytR/AlgR family response regulator transcription factor [bacterium]
MSVRTIIVDDEDLARRMIKEYLDDFPVVEIIAECSSGNDAVQAIKTLQPDLVFLDIQMPELTGFEVLQKLDIIPSVIFSTAFDKYALHAFEVNAVDYLLKPYDRERFQQALNRALDRLQQGSSSAQVLSILKYLRTTQTDADKFWVKDNGSYKPVAHNEIDWIEAMDDYACLHVGEKTYLVSQTMQRLEARLDDKKFMRIHRSTIVNLERVREIRPEGDGRYQVILKNGTQLALSRSQAKKLRGLMI